MDQKVIKTGNSLAITVPANFVKLVGVRPGETIKVSVDPGKGKMTCIFPGIKQLPLSENFLKVKRIK